MVIYRFEAYPTPILGAWSDNTLSIAGSYMSQLYVRAVGANKAICTFDVVVTDYAGRRIRVFETCTEVWNDLTETPVTGVLTIGIENASHNEPFEVMACFHSE